MRQILNFFGTLLVGAFIGFWLCTVIFKAHVETLDTEHLRLQVKCLEDRDAYWRDITECKQQGCKL